MDMYFFKFLCKSKKNFERNDENGLALFVKPVNASCIEENWMTFTSLNDVNTFMNWKFK